MERINIAWFQKLGIVIGHLNTSLSNARFQRLGPIELRYMASARDWFKSMEDSDLSRSAVLARDLVRLLTPIVENSNPPEKLPEDIEIEITKKLTAFNNVFESEADHVFTYMVTDVGAYSTASLLVTADAHLSKLARSVLRDAEKNDFKLAGTCLALQLFTACGFHAMRATEAVARHYHKIVTNGKTEVDWTLNPLINGNSGKSQVGLRDQWVAEGKKNDSPLLLIISLLSAITSIYRNPIMHPEMTLNGHSAKTIFDTAAVAISTMVADGAERMEARKKAATKAP